MKSVVLDGYFLLLLGKRSADWLAICRLLRRLAFHDEEDWCDQCEVPLGLPVLHAGRRTVSVLQEGKGIRRVEAYVGWKLANRHLERNVQKKFTHAPKPNFKLFIFIYFLIFYNLIFIFFTNLKIISKFLCYFYLIYRIELKRTLKIYICEKDS